MRHPVWLKISNRSEFSEIAVIPSYRGSNCRPVRRLLTIDRPLLVGDGRNRTSLAMRGAGVPPWCESAGSYSASAPRQSIEPTCRGGVRVGSPRI